MAKKPMARKTAVIANRLACQDVFLGFMDNLATSVGGLIESGQRESRGMTYASRTLQFTEKVNGKSCGQWGFLRHPLVAYGIHRHP
jgi:hypothetical protein